MPPKKRVEKHQIVQMALEMTRREGFERVTLRSLAAALGCSTQPLYQAFDDRRALEQEVARVGCGYMMRRIFEESAGKQRQELNIVLEYIRFAREEGNLFRLIAQNGMFAAPSQGEEGARTAPALSQKLIIFANGIVLMTAFQAMEWTWEQIVQLVTEAYEDFERERKETP